jgi:hypothetical protein
MIIRPNILVEKILAPCLYLKFSAVAGSVLKILFHKVPQRENGEP